MIWLILTLWVVCGYLATGIAFAYFHREYPASAEDLYEQNVSFALRWSLGGPITLLVGYFGSDRAKHGLLYPWQVKHDRH